MGELQLIGTPISTYVRVCRMAAEEKGVPYRLDPAMPHTPDVDALHPLGKVPVMRHGDVTLFESKAICTYIDRVFKGPALVPDDPVEAARVEQWVSLVNTAYDRTMIRDYVLPLMVPSESGEAPDRAALDAAVAEMTKQIAFLDRHLKNGALVGDEYTLADINLMPILFYLRLLPEGQRLIAAAKNVAAFYDRHAERPSFAATMPPLPDR